VAVHTGLSACLPSSTTDLEEVASHAICNLYCDIECVTDNVATDKGKEQRQRYAVEELVQWCFVNDFGRVQQGKS